MLDSTMGLIARVWFKDSASYWEWRYRAMGSSGQGSYGESAVFKASYVNRFVFEHQVETVIEFGCGDGAQLSLLELPYYIGVDISRSAVERCQERFKGDPTKHFVTLGDYKPGCAELALSMDVIYHLVEDDVFEQYMGRLFAAGSRYVVIYSSDHDEMRPRGSRHVRHRNISTWCAAKLPSYRLIEYSDPFPGSDNRGPRFLSYERVKKGD